MTQLTVFIVLQVLDLLTTLWFLAHGGREGNPIVIWLASFAPSFTIGLLCIKAWAIAMGWVMEQRSWTLGLIIVNCVFMCVVAWNLVGICFG